MRFSTIRILTTALLAVLTLPFPDTSVSQTNLTVPAGQRLAVRLDSQLSSNDSKTNQRFSTTLVVDIAVNGAVALRRGDKIYGRVIEAKKAGRVVRKAGLNCELTEVVRGTSRYPIITYPFDIEGEKSGDVKKIAVKAAAGAVIGGADLAARMAKGGTALAVITPGKQIELPKGIIVEFYLSQPVTVQALTVPVALDPVQTALKTSNSNTENAKRLMQYRWRDRIELKKDGETKSVKEMLVSFDDKGNRKLEPIGAQEEKSKRGLRGRIQKKKKKKVKELIDSVREMISSYAMMSPGQTVDYLQKSSWSPAADDLNGTVQFEGVDVMNPGDWVVLWIDMTTYQPRKLYFKVALGDDVLQGEINYKNLDSGVFYSAETKFVMPTKKIEGTVQSTEHHQL